MPGRVPVTFWNTAETVTEPALTPVRYPREPVAFDTVALVAAPPSALDTSQVTLFVMSAVVGGVSAQVPVAVSCWCPPTTTLSGLGAMSIELRAALLTGTFEVPETGIPEGPW